MSSRTSRTATLVATLMALSLVATVTALGVGTAGAVHPSDAPDLSEEANFTVNFPYATDHYPGDENEENGSVQYFASGADAFAVQDAEEGVYMDWIIVHAEYDGEDWIDYSACSTDNTAAFGIDRGNNNSGTEYDQDLIQHREDDQFRDDGIVVEFFDWEDVPNDPPYLAPEDAIVAAQGDGSPLGPCLTLTEEPGWYRIAGFMNATVADNGPDEQPSENAERVSLELNSNYLYVCRCDSEAEARDELGPPPNERDDEPTPTETGDDPTPTATDAGGDPGTATPTDAGDDPGTATATDADDDPDTETDPGGDTDDGDDVDDGDATPAADGPGFGALGALVALLAGALLVHRLP